MTRAVQRRGSRTSERWAWQRAAILAGFAFLAALLPLRASPYTSARAASAPVVVLTATTFPAGLGLGVAADPLGLQNALWAPLVGFDDHLRPYAVLATRVPTVANGDVKIVGGGLRVTVHLKPNLRFSDGSPITADDVRFGLRVNLDPALGNSFGLDEIAHTAAPDAHTLVISFNDTYGAYLAYALPPALPRRYLERKYHSTDIHTIALAYARDPYMAAGDVFSGSYRVGEVAQGQRLTLVPNRYFSALPPASAGHASLPRPELRYVVLSNDQTALAEALRSPRAGVDVALGFAPSLLSNLQGLAAGLRAHVAPALSVEHLELNQATPALRDVRVRRALQDAIDKPALARAVFPPSLHPTVATTLIPSASPYHDTSIPASRVDVAGGRSLLRAAGYTPSLSGPGKHLRLTLVTTNDPMRRREADLLTKSFAAIGVRLTTRLVSASPLDRGGLYAPYNRDGVLATRSFDLALFDLRLGPDPATVASLFDPDRVPTPISWGNARRNYTGIDNEALAQLPEVAQSALDIRSRELGYDKLQREVNSLLPYIVLFELPRIVVDDGRTLNLRPAPYDGGTFWNAWQWARR